jgi:hypothetical protein
MKKLRRYEYLFEPAPDCSLRGLRLTDGRESEPLLFEVALAPAHRAGPWRALSARTQDLLDAAAAITAADRLSKRNLDGDGYGWGRRLQITLPVREPDFWSEPQLTECLRRLLYSLTGDEWLFDWRPRSNSVTTQTRAAQPVLLNVEVPNSEFVLLSGGLDSFAGACGLLRERKESRFGLVSIVTGDRVAGIQHDVSAAMRHRFHGRVYPVEVPVYLSHPSTRPRLHRSRPFLFHAVGAVVAHACGARRLYQCENGVASLCLPLTPGAFPWQTSRGVLPRLVREMGSFLSKVFESEFRIENPFLLHTKAQMCCLVQDVGLDRAVGLTVSCDRFPQRVPAYPVCGICGPCVLRRQALHASGLSLYDNKYQYRYDITRSSAAIPSQIRRIMNTTLGQHARVLAALQTPNAWQSLCQIYTELEATKRDVARALDVSEATAQAETCSMLYRFAEEWDRFPLCTDFRTIVSVGDRRLVRREQATAISLPLFDPVGCED